MRYISIDPGKKGAAVLMEGIRLLDVYIFEGVEEGINCMDWYEKLLRWYDEAPIKRVYIERISPMPGQSIYTSAEQFYTLGQTKACVMLLNITLEEIYPRTWMAFVLRVLGPRAKKKTGKEMAQIAAKKFYKEGVRPYTPRSKVHDGLADALGLMMYTQSDYFADHIEDEDDLICPL